MITYSESKVRQLRDVFASADAECVESGVNWYPEAGAFAEDLAADSGVPMITVCAVIAHLSPRLDWRRNKRAAIDMVMLGYCTDAGVLSQSQRNARRALEAADPLETFSTRARKTSAFAHNLYGYTHRVTVDMWAARAWGIQGSQGALNGTEYRQIEADYIEAAKREGFSPRDFQAIVWCAIRGKAE